MTRRIYCQVLEIPSDDQWTPRPGAWPRDLLPWADPYIARLMHRLEEQYSTDGDLDWSNPFADRALGRAELDSPSAAWQDDAFMPQPIDGPRFRWHRPVYGGFPLLEDDSDD